MAETISTEPLAQLLRSIALQKRTGIVRVEQLGEKNPQQGQIYFENGHLMRARSGQETGQKALQLINEWKQITCAFYGMNRPFPLKTEMPAPAHDGQVQQQLLARLQASKAPETDKLTRASEASALETLKNGSGQPVRRSKETDKLPTSQPLEDRRETPARLTSSLVHDQRQVAMPGTSRAAHTSEKSTGPRSIDQWETYLNPYRDAHPTRPPATPRLGVLTGEEELPGRTAIFKARESATTAQIIQSMERHERLVFILLDGRRTVQHIARLTHQPESDVEEILIQLTKIGYTHYVCG